MLKIYQRYHNVLLFASILECHEIFLNLLLKMFVSAGNIEKVLYENLKLSNMKLASPNNTIRSILGEIQKKHFLGITSHQNPNQVTGIISYIDIIRYLFKKEIKTALDDPIEWTLTLSYEDESYLVWERDVKDTCGDVCNTNQALKAFANGLHSGVIMNGKQHLLLTQQDILRYIITLDEFKTAMKKSLSEWFPWKSFEGNGLIKIQSDASVSDGIKLLIKTKLPAIPVLDGDVLTGSLSSETILNLDSDNINQILELKLRSFLEVFGFNLGAKTCILRCK